MPGKRLTDHEKFMFLINCIRFTPHGRPDYAKLAQEYKISKEAAWMRYYNLLKPHGISVSGEARTGKRENTVHKKEGNTRVKSEATAERPLTPVKMEQVDHPDTTPPLSTSAGSVESTPKSSRSPKTPKSSSSQRRGIKRQRLWENEEDFTDGDSPEELIATKRTGLRKRQKKAVYAPEWDEKDWEVNEDDDELMAFSL